MRVRDSKGKEWLVYHVSLFGNDWEGDTVDFFYMEGKVTDGSTDGKPIWSKRINPATEEIDYGKTEILDHRQTYTIAFSKAKVNGLIPFMQQQPHSFTVQMPNGKRESCSEEQFTNRSYAELVSELTGFSEYVKMRNKHKYNGN